MKRTILDVSPRELFSLFLTDCETAGVSARAIDHLRNAKREPSKQLITLEKKWYKSLATGRPDYSVYATEEYLEDLWACWYIYSRKYLRHIRAKLKIRPAFVLDLGCGFGYTTAALSQMFPRAKVVGTNLPGTVQMKIAKRSAKGYTIEDLSRVQGRPDLVFASEYFEHHERPIEHLRKVLALKPRALLVANTFNARSIGHFDEYTVDGQSCTGPATSRRFSQELLAHGFEGIPTGFWNSRPTYWRLRRGQR